MHDEIELRAIERRVARRAPYVGKAVSEGDSGAKQIITLYTMLRDRPGDTAALGLLSAALDEWDKLHPDPLPSDDTMREYIVALGWRTYYNENYWVHQKTVENPKAQDYTNYGMPLERAYIYETTDEKPFPQAPFGLDLPGAGVRGLPRED